MIKLIHSYQYLDLSKQKSLFIKNGFIVDEKDNKKIKLFNIPVNGGDTLYNIFLEKLLVKKKSIKNIFIRNLNLRNEVNICIYITINYDRLIEYIKNGEMIPEHDLFFKLLRRNYKKKIDITQLISKYCIKLDSNELTDIFNKSNFNLITGDIIKFGDIYIDIKLERFYLSIDNIKSHKQIIPVSIFISNPCGKFRDIICNKSQKICIICDQENISRWTKDNYFILDKYNILKYTEKSIGKITIISKSLFISLKYKNLWTSYRKNNQSLKEALNTLKLMYSYNPNIKSELLFHLIEYEYLILDDCLVDKEILDCFTYKNLLYITDNIKLNIKELQLVTKELFNLDITSLNFNHLKDNIIMESFYSMPLNIIQKNLNNYSERFIMDSIPIYKQHIYNSLDLNVYPVKYSISSSANIKSITCSICLETIDNNDVGKLDCVHLFCYSCLKKINSNNCPLCRSSFDKITKIIQSEKFLPIKLQFLYSLKNSIIFSKYNESIINLSAFYNDLGLNNIVINSPKKVKKNNDTNYLLTFDNYKFIENSKLTNNIYLLDKINITSDIYIKCILKKLNINNITIINNLY